ncbi:MAG TPA: hypothetical protein VGS21_11835, partial [Acidimicrobiales bacterium]|nr:hypothetical protein [Acidimicrobiales bacterium]
MGWQLTSDLEEFCAQALPLLRKQPTRNTIPLTILAALREGLGWSDTSPIYAVLESDDGRIDGAALMTPPWSLLLAEVPLEAIGDLVR